MFRTILGVCGAYFLTILSESISMPGGLGMHLYNLTEFEAQSVVPLAIGAVAGFCWHMITKKTQD